MRAIWVVCVLCACGKSDNAIDKGASDRGHGPVKKVKEAELQLNAIAKKAKVVFGETGKFPVGSSKVLPAGGDGKLAGGCCGTANNKCAVTKEWASDPVWKALEFSIDEESNYRYKYESTDGASFVATAAGDLDCDAQEAVYTLKGSVVNGNATVELVQPPPNVY